MSVNRTWKNLALGAGLLVLLVVPGAGCLALAMWAGAATGGDLDDPQLWQAVLLGLSTVALMAFAGWTWLNQGQNSLQRKPSPPLKAPPLWAFAGAWVALLVVGLGWLQTDLQYLFFPFVFIAAGALPPLAAVAWSGGARMQAGQDEISKRQALLGLTNGATLAVGMAIILEVIFGVTLAVLLSGPLRQVQPGLEALFEELTTPQAGQALGSAAFLAALVELALIAPLVEEFVKPLSVLPMLRAAETPRRAFLIGAAAGAGFAALENLLYTGFGLEAWGGVLVLRTLGAAIHPLGAGLTAVAWRAALRGEKANWLPNYALAVGLHALWNGGSLILITLADARFFGSRPAEVDILGITEAGAVIAALAALGAAAWAGLRLLAPTPPVGMVGERLSRLTTPSSSDRLLTLWALLCLVIFLPLGLAALSLLRGGP